MTRAHGESSLQTTIMGFLGAALPASYRAFAVPNGGNRDRITGAILNREGVRAGVPDIVIIRSEGVAAFLEVKTETGRLSSSQIEWRDWCSEHRVPYAVVRSIGDVEAFLLDLNVPMRARVAA